MTIEGGEEAAARLWRAVRRRQRSAALESGELEAAVQLRRAGSRSNSPRTTREILVEKHPPGNLLPQTAYYKTLQRL